MAVITLVIFLALSRWNARQLGAMAEDVTTDCPEDKPQVFLTVSSLSRDGNVRGITAERLLELNWYGFEVQDGDKILLLNQSPEDEGGIINPLVSINVLDHGSAGYWRTNYSFPKVIFTPSNLTSSCLGFWIAYVRNVNQILSWSCLRAQPFWMWENREHLRNFRLRDIMIPGTHNSGCYLENQREDIVTRYMYTHDENVFNQLAYGNRALDIRVGFYNRTPEKFWINHSFYKTSVTVLQLLRVVKQFINATKEMVILDFHRFPKGFDKDHEYEIHNQLIELITRELGEYMLPKSVGETATLGDMWSTGKRVLVAYNNRARHRSSLIYGSPLHQAWGDTEKTRDLKDYFQQYINSKIPKGLWAAMAALTPKMGTVFMKPTKGLRGFADDVNRNVTIWFRDLWWDVANIIDTDFFLGNNIVDVAIVANQKRKCRLESSR